MGFLDRFLFEDEFREIRYLDDSLGVRVHDAVNEARAEHRNPHVVPLRQRPPNEVLFEDAVIPGSHDPDFLGGREHDLLGFLVGAFPHQHLFPQADARVVPDEVVHADDSLSLVFLPRRPDDGSRLLGALYFHDVPGSNAQLFLGLPVQGHDVPAHVAGVGLLDNELNLFPGGLAHANTLYSHYKQNNLRRLRWPLPPSNPHDVRGAAFAEEAEFLCHEWAILCIQGREVVAAHVVNEKAGPDAPAVGVFDAQGPATGHVHHVEYGIGKPAIRATHKVLEQ